MSESTSRIKLILEDYYREAYTEVLYNKSFLSLGVNYFHKQVEKHWNDSTSIQKQLEIGVGNGEHLNFVKKFPDGIYIGIDVMLPKSNLLEHNICESGFTNFQFIQADVQDLPFEANFFDRVVSTCVFHHINEPILGLQEIRRVTKNSGEISILLSTDPGMLNRLSRYFITNRKIKRYTTTSPKLIYALDHKNHISSLIEMIKYVFEGDNLEFYYAPFTFLRSWNANLSIVAKVCVVK